MRRTRSVHEVFTKCSRIVFTKRLPKYHSHSAFLPVTGVSWYRASSVLVSNFILFCKYRGIKVLSQYCAAVVVILILRCYNIGY